jgi:transcriptional regulator with XRE-family HTH domain
MDARKTSPSAGERLKELRERLGLTTRDVETRSLQIAEEKHNREYYLSHAWVTDIENGKFTPSIYKFFTFSAIYHRRFSELLSYFGLQIGDLSRYRTSIGVPNTHLLDSGADLETEKVSLPVQFKPEFRLEKTNLLARVVEKWDEIPVGFLPHLDLRKSVYGYIGLEDYTLFPLIRPGSLVQMRTARGESRSREISSWHSKCFSAPCWKSDITAGTPNSSRSAWNMFSATPCADRVVISSDTTILIPIFTSSGSTRNSSIPALIIRLPVQRWSRRKSRNWTTYAARCDCSPGSVSWTQAAAGAHWPFTWQKTME